MSSTTTRRDFLKRTGVLVVGFSLGLHSRADAAVFETGAAPAANQLDSWLAINADGTITVYSGKVELGTGVSTALRQIVAEELDAPFEKIAWVQGDSDRTVDQGSTVGSQTIKRGGAQLRMAAATARAALLELAAPKLGAAPGSLEVASGVVRVHGDPSRHISFAELLGGKRFERTVNSAAVPKATTAYTIVGKPVHRVELPAKMTGRHTYVQDVKVDGMLHARVVRPASIGAKLLSVDDSALGAIPGARVIRKADFLAVVAPREYDAIRAAAAIKPAWSESATLPPMDELKQTLMSIPSTERGVASDGTSGAGRVAKRLAATYKWPFQMHASIGPSCGVADVRNGKATVWSSTQGSHTLKSAIAHLLGMQPDDVHVIWIEGSGCYGHNGSDDAAADAAVISREVGAPVRVQWSRADEHGWEPKGAAMVMQVAAGIDASGKIADWDYQVWTPTHSSRPGAQPGGEANFIAARLMGMVPSSRGSLGGERNAAHTYSVPAMKVRAHLLERAPLRTSSLRGLGSPQNTFANESFMDELAQLAGVDPIEFRLRHLSDPRAVAAINAVARLAKWTPRVSGSSRAPSNGVARGRGMAFVRYEGTEASVAAIVDVEVDQAQHRVRVTHAYVAHDCGLIVNPDGLKNQIEGNVIQAASRALNEAVQFDRSRVTSLDWRGYPILRFADAPDAVDVVLIDHPELPSVGAGEASTSPIPAAIANAIFDATGVRLRDVPLRV